MTKTTLVVMAAGMGSRFGGLKQIEPLGPNGEIIIDYSVYDARLAGFSKAVFIIKHEIEKDFRDAAGRRIEKLMDVDYVFQDINDIPKGFSVPLGRTKPWGTGQAIMAAKKCVDTPFLAINADDYYGQKTFKLMGDYLRDYNEMCMAGFSLGNTLTENGTVSRGICEVEDGYLKGVNECAAIDKNSGIPLDKTVSMNMWGLRSDIFDTLEKYFVDFLAQLDNPLKSEYYIPLVIDRMIREQNTRVKVLPTEDRWYGVTYKEDADAVKAAIAALTNKGLYEGL